jgi:hypothetical protein
MMGDKFRSSISSIIPLVTPEKARISLKAFAPAMIMNIITVILGSLFTGMAVGLVSEAYQKRKLNLKVALREALKKIYRTFFNSPYLYELILYFAETNKLGVNSILIYWTPETFLSKSDDVMRPGNWFRNYF